jgi:selenocysteine lyase/cysteine desulfurase
MSAIRSYEESLSMELLRIMRECGATVYGVADESRVHERVPTMCFNLKGVAPAAVTEAASRAGIGIRDGHMYTPRLMRRLGLQPDSGVVRASLVHYNTKEEIRRFGNVLLDLTRHE